MPVAIAQPADEVALQAAIDAEAMARANADALKAALGTPQTQNWRVGGYHFAGAAPQGSVFAIPSGWLYFIPLYTARAVAFDQVGIEITTGQAGATTQLGLYANDAAIGLPAARLADYGSVDCSALGFKDVSISLNCTPGWYWLAVLSLATGTPATFRVTSPGSPIVGGYTRTAGATSG